MKKMLLTTLVAVCSTGVWAEGKPLACQGEISGGLIWKNGRWTVTKFTLPSSEERFILVLEGDTMSKTSVAKLLTGNEKFSSLVTCTNVNPQIRCEDRSGGSLYYERSTNRGGIAQILGATETGNKRDTLSVTPFSCQPF